jgi:hypothetical protein
MELLPVVPFPYNDRFRIIFRSYTRLRVIFLHFLLFLLLLQNSKVAHGGFICSSFGNPSILSTQKCNYRYVRYNTNRILHLNQNADRINNYPIKLFSFSLTSAFVHQHFSTTAGASTPYQIFISDATTTMVMTDNDSIGMLSKEMTILIFIIGIIPFIIATYEFWRRIAVGATFGTGKDSVVFPTTTITTIGEDNAPTSSRGKQILGQDSLITAYLIFTTVAIVLGIVLYAVVTSPIPSSI